mmetsp:Transcript_67791/g.155876  ORF Transcript_67791/g.155876 Transcript_67791/m.155876 type:complete len:319 (+) Transcript_67791:219-1175(+)
MAVVWSANLKRRFYAPGLSGASIFIALVYLSLIIASFLIAFYSEGLWLKESSYREQPQVEFGQEFAMRLLGENTNTRAPFELVYSTVAAMNVMAGGEAVRIPSVRVEKVHENRDYIPDAIDISISFPTRDFEAIRQVMGVLVFRYVLVNRVRLDMEAPIAIDYSAGVPGRRLTIDGRMALKLANPLPIRGSVRGAGEEGLFPRGRVVSAEEASFEALLAKVASRNDTAVLDPVITAWAMPLKGCEPRCAFEVKLRVRMTPEKVLYVPGFVEVCKFSWIQIIATFLFLYILLRPLLVFVFSQQIIQTEVRDDAPCEKFD